MSEDVKQAIMEFETAINFKTATVMPMEYSIDIENAKVLLKYIEQLQQENNILTEFEKWLKEEIEKRKEANNPLDPFQVDSYYIKLAAKTCLDKLQELKEGKK